MAQAIANAITNAITTTIKDATRSNTANFIATVDCGNRLAENQ